MEPVVEVEVDQEEAEEGRPAMEVEVVLVISVDHPVRRRRKGAVPRLPQRFRRAEVLHHKVKALREILFRGESDRKHR